MLLPEYRFTWMAFYSLKAEPEIFLFFDFVNEKHAEVNFLMLAVCL